MISIRDAEEILKKEYHIDNFKYVIKELLLPDFAKDEHEVYFNNNLFESVTQLGTSEKCDVTIYEVILKEGAQNRRVTITQEMFRILRGQGINNAIVAFSNADYKNYRLSLLTSKYEFEGDKIVKILSNPRRYSYSLGYGTKTKTAYEFLISKGKVNSIEELIGRFSVEVVNKQFYNEIAVAFTKLVGGTREGKTYAQELGIHGVADKNKYAEFAVRLIGRIVFCWFLKEKKSENGIPLVPESMLSVESTNTAGIYYHDVLEPLFFELLNTKQERRKGKFAKEEIYAQIPYLNGGLFSPHQDDHYKYAFATETGTYGLVNIPNDWFTEFYGVLSQYNFTVDENTSYDIELSIDPEMLGRIFENLLAEINPETGENAKKSTGSFYTPRDIVDYMVDNSIFEYLKGKTNIEDERLKALISYGKEDDELAVFSKAEKKAIINALYTVTVLDPACGSGAFPIGMLQKIVYILQEVDPEANLWFDKATENISILMKREFEKKFNAGSLDYIRKLSVIQNSIFGVDIQPIAVEIARLRCFLSLVIEEKVEDSEYNRGVNPLPNLDFKFIIANTLMDLPNDTNQKYMDNATQVPMFENQDHIAELKAVREEYFSANDAETKNELKLEFAEIQKAMFQETLANRKIASRRYQELSDWAPFSNKLTNWFDPEWMFGVKDGFDIVIGNPPYIKIQNLDKQFANELKSRYASASGKFDIYVLFMEKSFELLGDKGICTFIQPHRFLIADYGVGIRKIILDNKWLYKFLHFGVNQVFETATTYTGIFFYKKNSSRILYSECKNKDFRYLDYSIKEYSNLKDVWVFKNSETDSVLNKIYSQKIDLLNVFEGIYQGVITNGDDIFVLDGEFVGNEFKFKSPILKRDFIIEKEILKPLLKGEHIRRYKQPTSNLVIVYPHYIDDNGKTRAYEEIDIISKFPKFYDYISNFREYLIDKKIKYKTNEKYWYSLHRSREMQIFERNKILTPQLQNYPNFTVDEQCCYPDAGGYCLNIKDENEDDLLYYLSILNSKLFWFFIKNTSTPFSHEYYYFKTAYIAPFKFPCEVDSSAKKELSELAKKLYNANESESINKRINEIVYRIYGLSEQEIIVVEND